jgi:hypothetical protein
VQYISSQHFDMTYIQTILGPIPPTSPAPCPSLRDIQDYLRAAQITESTLYRAAFRQHDTLTFAEIWKKQFSFSIINTIDKIFICSTWWFMSTSAFYLLTNGLIIIIGTCMSKPTIMSHLIEHGDTSSNLSDFIGDVPWVWILAGTPRNSSLLFRPFKVRPLRCVKTSVYIPEEQRPRDLLNTLTYFPFNLLKPSGNFTYHQV